MAIMQRIKKIVAYFKFLKPQTFTYRAYPQTIKSPSVTVTKSDKYDGLFIGSDGEAYVEKVVTCHKRVQFSDGQVFKNGDVAYFKVEPIVWQVGGYIYEREEIKDRKGNVKDTKHKKTDKRYCVSQYILSDKNTVENIYAHIEDEGKFTDVAFKVCATVANCYGYFSTDWTWTSSARRNSVKRATDYALACGVSVKGGKAYHTDTGNGLCVFPNGKGKDFPKNVVVGELILFYGDEKTVKQCVERDKAEKSEGAAESKDQE